MASSAKVSVPSVLSTFTELWSQRLVASLDAAYEIKVAKIDGQFVWHSHPDNDELFYVLKGSMILHLADQDDVQLKEGDLYVVPKGVRHKPVGNKAEIMLIEKAGVINTGDAEKSAFTIAVADERLE